MSKYDDIPSWACSDVIDFNSAENVNKILKQNGYTNPFYKPGANEVPEWGLGGGLQFDLMGQYFNSFGNFRPL